MGFGAKIPPSDIEAMDKRVQDPGLRS